MCGWAKLNSTASRRRFVWSMCRKSKLAGDYTIVHVGFALQRLNEKSALEKLEMFRALGILEEILGVADYTDVAAS